jgi:two-component sensor histidine kinase
VRPPAKRGFGSRLIERALAGEFGGAARLQFEPSGLVCVVDAPLAA